MLPGSCSDYIDIFYDLLEEWREPPLRVLSVGCGAGDLERKTAQRLPACEIHGIDVSAACLEKARYRAAAAGHNTITYEEIDAVSYLEDRVRREDPPLDGILCHGVLHHLGELESFLELARRALRPDGFLYAFEYVGPSREEWTKADLGWAQQLYDRAPKEYYRVPRVLPPLAIEDPTEMIRSSEIETLLERWFSVDRYWPHGGNVVVPLVASLKKHSHEDSRVHKLIQDALDLETFLLERGLIHSYFSSYYCTPLESSQDQGETGSRCRRVARLKPIVEDLE